MADAIQIVIHTYSDSSRVYSQLMRIGTPEEDTEFTCTSLMHGLRRTLLERSGGLRRFTWRRVYREPGPPYGRSWFPDSAFLGRRNKDRRGRARRDQDVQPAAGCRSRDRNWSHLCGREAQGTHCSSTLIYFSFCPRRVQLIPSEGLSRRGRFLLRAVEALVPAPYRQRTTGISINRTGRCQSPCRMILWRVAGRQRLVACGGEQAVVSAVGEHGPISRSTTSPNLNAERGICSGQHPA